MDFTLHPGPGEPATILALRASSITLNVAIKMREDLDDLMTQGGYTQVDRQAARDILHLVHAVRVLEVAWPQAVPPPLEEHVRNLNRDVERAIAAAIHGAYRDAMREGPKPTQYPNQGHIAAMQAFYKGRVEEMTRENDETMVNNMLTMTAILNRDMVRDNMLQTDLSAAKSTLPLHYALHILEQSVEGAQPLVISRFVDCMREEVYRALSDAMYVEYRVCSQHDLERYPLPTPLHIDAASMYCARAVNEALVEE